MAVKKKPAKKATSKTSEKTSAFVSAMKKKGKGVLKAFSSAKKGGGGFDLSVIKDGVYKTRWTAKSGISKDGDPYVMLLWIVTSGKYKGEKGSRYFNMGDTDQASWASSMIQAILDVDVAGCDDAAEIKELLDQMNEDKPVTKTKIERKKTKKGEFINCYIQEIVDSEDDDEEDEEENDDESEEDEDSEESDEEDEDDSEEEEESEDEEEDEVDYETLGSEADEGDKAALKELKRLAKEADIDPDDYEDWASLAEALSEPSEDEEEDEDSEEDDSEEDDEDEEGEIDPSKGDEFEYKPPRSKRTYEVIVTRVNKSKETVALEEKDGEQTWKDVPWDKLINP